jgi:putative transposase
VVLSTATFRPNAAWGSAQAQSFVAQARAAGLPLVRLMHDRDSALSQPFDSELRRNRVKILRTPFRAPNTNAYAKRFVQSIKHECINHFVLFGLDHFDVLCREYLEHYHTEWPHQGIENELPVRLRRRRRQCVAGDAQRDRLPAAPRRLAQVVLAQSILSFIAERDPAVLLLRAPLKFAVTRRS